MNPETVNMMMQLRDLNKFFDDNPRSEAPQMVVPGPDRSCNPSIMVSTSTVVMPISLSSTGTLDTPENVGTTPLAIRRGCRLPQQLKLKAGQDIPYPGVPTPFVGTPSAYKI
ncbi:hypothetical protein PUNSTDRAFT_65550, partial [Punctularia strigosozonata HHB-11173 SS5]|uniref:uncharacterized protein n=1 Tax=Punctularia strigosozonata (strain HHB-11173) TaxID=741275 RepID=UPI00044171DF